MDVLSGKSENYSVIAFGQRASERINRFASLLPLLALKNKRLPYHADGLLDAHMPAAALDINPVGCSIQQLIAKEEALKCLTRV